MSESVTITVTMETLWNRPGSRYSNRVLYTCTGPDGKQFEVTGLVDLRDVLRRRYGKVTIVKNDQRVPMYGAAVDHAALWHASR